MSPGRPTVLLVGGLDPTGRAGLLADAAAVLGRGGVPLAVASALTAQGGRRFALNPVAPGVFRAQLDSALSRGAPGAVKVGMLADAAQLRELVRALAGLRVPVVLDPVVRTSRGERLSRLAPQDVRRLGRWGWVLTPNRDELDWLGGDAPGLLALGFAAVVVKGGETATDLLHLPGAPPRRFAGPRLARRTDHRGTGCRFASALAASLARGAGLPAAVRAARAEVARYLARPPA